MIQGSESCLEQDRGGIRTWNCASMLSMERRGEWGFSTHNHFLPFSVKAEFCAHETGRDHNFHEVLQDQAKQRVR